MECLMRSAMYTCLYACLIVLVVEGTIFSVTLLARFMRDMWEDK